MKVCVFAVALLFSVSFLLEGAPAPPGEKKPPAKKVAGPITLAEIQRMNTLTWGEQVYPIAFQKDSYYYCTDLDKDNKGRVWFGPYILNGSTIIIDESSSWQSPDEPPKFPAGPHDIRLELRRCEKGGIIGEGWGNNIKLERR